MFRRMFSNPKKNMFSEKRELAKLNYIRLNYLISSLGMRTLRLQFRDRYKLITHMDWENGSASLNEDFIKREGSSLKLTRGQEKALDGADINRWDFSLLITILLRMGSRISKVNQVEQNAEDDALKMLEYIRNKVTQLSRQGIPDSEFGPQWQIARDALLRLGAQEKDIEHFLTSSTVEGLESSRATFNPANEAKSKALRDRAEELLGDGDFEEGIQLYSEALLLSGLSKEGQSWLHSGRSQAYITQLEDCICILEDDVIQDYMGRAIEDAKLAVRLQSRWWKGHFLEAKCFQYQNRMKEAIDSFEKALSLKPGSQEIINARDLCKLEDEEADLDALCSTLNILPETPHSWEENQLIIESQETMMEYGDTVEKARAYAFMGHRHLRGDVFPFIQQDEQTATELFREAAEAGSPDGAFNAGISYLRGFGVNQNIPEAIKYLEAAAKQKVKPGEEFEFDNDAIAKSKGLLATLYRTGVGKPRNYVKAAELYAQAALAGVGTGAAKLAGMLSVGVGIPRDSKRALQYQKLAVELGSYTGHVYYELARLYLDAGDLTQARYWYGRAVTVGFTIADSDRQYFEKQLQAQQRLLEDFKKKLPAHVLNSGVPIRILYDRYMKRHSPEWLELMQLKRGDDDAAAGVSSSSAFGMSSRETTHFDEMKKFASRGQEYARKMVNSFDHLCNGVQAARALVGLDHVVTDEASSSRREMLKKLALAEMAACYTVEAGFSNSNIPTDCTGKLVEIAKEVIAAGVKSDSDRNARICLLILSMTPQSEEALNFVKTCKELYPEQQYFHATEGQLLGYLDRQEEGLRVVEEGLKLFPDNADLLFYRALYLPTTPLQIKAYQDFIRKAPSGHRHVPGVYYSLANLYATEGALEDFETYYALGLEAEKKLPSNFLPYASSSKKTSELLLKLSEAANLTYSPKLLERLLETNPEEMEENWKLKLTDPKRIVAVKDCRSRFASWEVEEWEGTALGLRLIPPHATNCSKKGQQKKKRAPSRQYISSLRNIRFRDMDPSIDRAYKGRVINLTIMEEYIGWITDGIVSVVKDDNDDFNVICFYNFDRSHPSTKKTLGFGSRIRLMNPYLVPRTGGPAIRVDDPNNVVLVSSGEENPICRYCWKPNPGPRCSKCKTAQYCNKECQKLDWEVLGHKELCKVLSKRCRLQV